jgi:hypothetical protein
MLIFIFSMMVFNTFAGQVYFDKKQIDNEYQFNYQWQDSDDVKHKIAFMMSSADLFAPFRRFKTFKPNQADNFIYLSIKRYLTEKPIHNVQVNFNRKQGKTQISIRAANQTLLEYAEREISELETQYRKQYLAENYYSLFTDADGQTGVKPDHVKFAHESIPLIKNLVEQMVPYVDKKDVRFIANYVLSFVQSIPYSALESRITSSGSGFNPPNNLLFQNQGDCDSKVTLTAAILKSMLPKLDLAIIYIPNHALIGIQAPYIEDEQHITIEGIDYVLAEPTGPAKYKIGHIAARSWQMISQQHYVAERF